MSDPPPRERDAWGRIALLIVGLVILIPSGLCTAVFYGASTAPDWNRTVLIFGGPFLLFGGFLAALGVFLALRK